MLADPDWVRVGQAAISEQCSFQNLFIPLRGFLPNPRKTSIWGFLPKAWRNVNLNGRYEFLKKVAPLNVDIIIRELAEIPINHTKTLAA
jgi:hypothetical protein